MTAQDQAARPLSKRTLLLATLGTLAAGALIVFGAIMPAEYDVDPLGVGKLSGLSRLWAPDENEVDLKASSVRRAQDYPAAWRTDVIEIPLASVDEGAEGSQLEYKVRLQKDGVVVYSWEVIGADDPQTFVYDFHGHTTPKTAREEMTVATYKQSKGLSGHGSLTAPFEGIHGWFFSNEAKKPVVVRVKLAGFYDLVPNGAPGNEARIRPNLPASQSRPDLPPSAP